MKWVKSNVKHPKNGKYVLLASVWDDGSTSYDIARWRWDSFVTVVGYFREPKENLFWTPISAPKVRKAK